jgi:carbamoyl-phosphate synthase large subunit
VLGEFNDVRAVAEAIVSALKPLGPCNVQLRMTDEGPVCFEINPRFSGSAPIRAHFGYNEAEAALEHFVRGLPVKLPLITEGVGLRYWNELYPDPGAVAELETRGELRKPYEHDHEIERWGRQ